MLLRSACAACGVIFDPADAGCLDTDYRARLWARRQLTKTGTWETLGLPSIRKIGSPIGGTELIEDVHKSKRFFKYDWENLTAADLFGTVRSRIGLGKSLWPRAIVSPAWDRPVILHHGLVEKFTTSRRTNSHLHLVSLAQNTIESPLEAWIGDYNGSLNLHLFARYKLGREIVTHMACVDTATAICTTIYHHDIGDEDMKRKGTFHYASWAAPA